MQIKSRKKISLIFNGLKSFMTFLEFYKTYFTIKKRVKRHNFTLCGTKLIKLPCLCVIEFEDDFWEDVIRFKC